MTTCAITTTCVINYIYSSAVGNSKTNTHVSSSILSLPLTLFLPSAVCAPRTTPLWPFSPAWCPRTARRPIGPRGAPAPRRVARRTCRLVTGSGRGRWRRFPLAEGKSAPPSRRRKPATSSETSYQTAPGVVGQYQARKPCGSACRQRIIALRTDQAPEALNANVTLNNDF